MNTPPPPRLHTAKKNPLVRNRVSTETMLYTGQEGGLGMRRSMGRKKRKAEGARRGALRLCPRINNKRAVILGFRPAAGILATKDTMIYIVDHYWVGF